MVSDNKNTKESFPRWNKWLKQSDLSPVVVVFHASWVGAKEIIETFLEKIGRQYPAVNVAWIDVEASPELSLHLGVNQVPTILILRHHEIHDMIIGTISRRKLQEKIERFL